MAAVKVLVVDDSITMRALFTNALERSKDIVVIGAAQDAAEAREMIAEMKPHVVTLDVEMPGMNGIDFLAEIMEERPMPVIMLSTLTHKGGEISLRALEIGAVDCFPKPARATPDEFAKISGKLCKVVLAAAKSNVHAKRAPARTAAVAAPVDYQWDGGLVAVAGGMGGTDAAIEFVAALPANCPPVILLQPLEPGMETAFAARLAEACAATVALAADGTALAPGHVYVAHDPALHVAVDRWPGGTLRLLDREPVNGARPSADMLFATLARTAGTQASVAILSGAGQDGAAGMGAVAAAGGRAIVQANGTALIDEAIAAAQARVPGVVALPPLEIAPALLARASVSAAA